MFRLAWCTDTHLNFLRVLGALESFVSYLKDEVKEISGDEPDAMVITGDIAEGSDFGDYIEDVKKAFGKPVYFILGNHDFYGSSFEASRNWAMRLGGYLTEEGPVHLTDEVALVGNDGWYDARVGDPSKLVMSDFVSIKDYRFSHREAIIHLAQVRADALAEEARVQINKALDTYPKVIFATHYPPFSRACWHEGKLSDPEWMPWFTSVVMGQMLADVAQRRPDKKILVLCGHTHSSGYYKPMDNLEVLTGQAKYYHPSMAGILEIDKDVRGYFMNGEKLLGGTWLSP